MKDKIVKEIKTKYKTLGFSEKAIDAVATLIEGQITEESEIGAAVDGVESVLKAFQGDADKRVTDAVKKAKTEKEDEKEKGKESVKEEAPKGEDVPSWAQGLIESNKALAQELNALKSSKTTESRKATLEAELADVSPALKDKFLKDFSRMTFESDESFNEFVSETKESLSGFEATVDTQGSNNFAVPVSGQKSKSPASSKQLDADIAAWAKAGAGE